MKVEPQIWINKEERIDDSQHFEHLTNVCIAEKLILLFLIQQQETDEIFSSFILLHVYYIHCHDMQCVQNWPELACLTTHGYILFLECGKNFFLYNQFIYQFYIIHINHWNLLSGLCSSHSWYIECNSPHLAYNLTSQIICIMSQNHYLSLNHSISLHGNKR